jgi:hypothetical protein
LSNARCPASLNPAMRAASAYKIRKYGSSMAVPVRRYPGKGRIEIAAARGWFSARTACPSQEYSSCGLPVGQATLDSERLHLAGELGNLHRFAA